MFRFTARDLFATLTVLMVLLGTVVVVRQHTQTFVSQAVGSSASDSAVPAVPDPGLQSVHSPDGTMKLVLTSQVQPDGETKYVAWVADVAGANRHTIYETTLPVGFMVVLPQNSWSPDNKFLFLKISSPMELAVKVFEANGAAFADGQTSIDVSALFKSDFPDLTLRDVTGWDDPALLHVMSYTTSTTFGSSYWFDVWGRSFIELARR